MTSSMVITRPLQRRSFQFSSFSSNWRSISKFSSGRRQTYLSWGAGTGRRSSTIMSRSASNCSVTFSRTASGSPVRSSWSGWTCQKPPQSPPGRQHARPASSDRSTRQTNSPSGLWCRAIAVPSNGSNFIGFHSCIPQSDAIYYAVRGGASSPGVLQAYQRRRRCERAEIRISAEVRAS